MNAYNITTEGMLSLFFINKRKSNGFIIMDLFEINV